MSKTILTGLKSNSNLTLGNYLGAILPMVKIQERLKEDDRFFLFVPDLHSFTTPVDHSTFYDATIYNIKTYLAAGIKADDPRIFLYRQSHISAHSEMNWILSCFTYYGEASRMIQFKEKSTQQGQNVSVGLFTYPILMAGDILLYNAEYVPLGDDQKQHLELTRDLAVRINNKFEQEVFVVPKPWKEQLEFMDLKEGVRIRSLSNPESKMSKSVTDPKGSIVLSDDPNDAAKKVMSATTDSFAKIDWDWENQAGITNLLQLAGLLGNKNFEEVKKDWVGGERYGDLKKHVAGLLEGFLSDFQNKMNNITETQVNEVLMNGETRATKIANETLSRVQKIIGLKK